MNRGTPNEHSYAGPPTSVDADAAAGEAAPAAGGSSTLRTAIPLYHTPGPSHPDGWHGVTSPGGYEWWYFDAEDPSADIQVVVILLEGFIFHPGYLRAYGKFIANPTRVVPPLPSEFPCAYLAVYEKGKLLTQFMSQYPPGSMHAATDRLDLALGENRVLTADDGSIQMRVSGTPWRLTWQGPKFQTDRLLSADLRFEPIYASEPMERTFLTRRMTHAEHHWVVANPVCRVSGRIAIAGPGGRTIAFSGRGYHDHNYGTAPIGPGLRRWFWGRAIVGEACYTFHHAEPSDPRLPQETHLIHADAVGLRELASAPADLVWDGTTTLGLHYPTRVNLGGVLRLDEPRVVDLAPFYMRMTCRATTPEGESQAFCEVAYPHRLLWPVLGRMIEMSIHRVGR